MTQPDASIVRVTNAAGETLGTGFLVSTDGLIATCAHVVEGTEPCVAFAGGDPRPIRAVANDPPHDVAILRLEGELPPGAEPARLGRSAEGYYSDFRSRGYRPLGQLEGIPAEGRVLHAVSECPGVRYLPLILNSQDIRKGMSGAPIYIPDWDLVVGMITDYWDSLKAGTGFADRDTALATPAEAITALCPDIRLWEPPPELSHPPLRVPFQAPAVPRYFVPRPEVSNELRSHLLPDESIAPGALVVSAVHGLGGIGKTTMVAAVAHDPTVQARFPDGVLWATLGHQPDVLSLLVGWIQALRDYDFRPTVVESASAHLRTLLHDKACLMVVDDAWQADQVRPFLASGRDCRLIITTRDATLARKVGARLYDLDVMTEAQALALFEARLGSLNDDREQAGALARELGYLPLALELAAAQVEAGLSWAELLEAFHQTLADLSVLDLDEATYRNESLRLSFSLSLDGLQPDGRGGLPPADRQAFTWLGVLSEEVRLNPSVCATLWDQPEADSRRRLRHLRGRALLKDVGNDQYAVHDLLHDEARLRLVECMSLQEAHSALIARYRAHTENALWHTLPGDGYTHDHLVWHMEQAGQEDEIHTLLREETTDGRNGWYQCRERLGQIAGYLADVKRAWQLAEKQFSQRALPLSIGCQCRYALITVSLNSIFKNVPPSLLAALVQSETWTVSQCLAYACQVPDSGQRAEALITLAPRMPASLSGKVLAAAREIEEETALAAALAGLVPRLAELGFLEEALAAAQDMPIESDRTDTLAKLSLQMAGLGHLKRALTAAREIVAESKRSSTLVELIPHLAPELLVEALAVARGIRDKPAQASALAVLVPRLAEQGFSEEAMTAAQDIPIESERTDALVELIPHLAPELLLEALAVARRIRDKPAQASALAAVLVPRLAELGHPGEALAAVQEIRGQYKRASTLIEILPHLPAELLGEALAAARGIEEEAARATALRGLAFYLPAELKEEVLQEATAAQQIKTGQTAKSRNGFKILIVDHDPKWMRLAAKDLDGYGIAYDGVTGIPDTPIPTLHREMETEPLEALTAAWAIEDENERASALAELVPRLARSSCPGEALTAAQAIPVEDKRIEVLAELALQMANLRQLEQALAAARAIESPWRQAGTLVNLIPFLSESLWNEILQEALTMTQAIRDEDERSKALVGMACYLPEQLFQEALALVQVIQDADEREKVLIELAPRLAGLDSLEALEVIKRIGDTDRQLTALMKLVSRLAELGQLEEALVLTRDLPKRDRTNRSPQVQAIALLLSHLPESLRDRALGEALAVVQELPKQSRTGRSPRAQVLAELAPYLPLPLLQKTLTAMWQLPDQYRTGGSTAMEALGLALAGLASYLPDSLRDRVLQQALEAAVNAPSRQTRVEMLVELAAYLPEPFLVKALGLVKMRITQSKPEQASVLTEFAVHLPEPIRGQILREALDAAKAIVSKWKRARALAKLAPHLQEPHRSRTLQETLAVVPEVGNESRQVQVLADLAPHLPESLSQEALEVALAIRGKKERAEALAALAPYLPAKLLARVRTIEDADDRMITLAGLAHQLIALQPATLYPLCQEALRTLAMRTRRDFLADIRALAPVIHKLGGEQAIAETFRAIQDVGRWWP